MAPQHPLRIAIVGAGIIGTTAALALLDRGFSVQIYEQNTEVKTTGGGISATPPAVKALKRCSKACYDAYAESGIRWGVQGPELYFKVAKDDEVRDLIADEEFGNMSRQALIEALSKRLPEGTINFGYSLKTLQTPHEGEVELEFENGETVTADVVLGCDGLKSKVRRYVVGDDHEPVFTHIASCRGLVPIKEVQHIVGKDLATSGHVGVGEGDGYVYYPVSEDVANLGYFIQHPEPWPNASSVMARWKKKDLLERMKTNGANAKHFGIVECLPDVADIWGMVHQIDPLPTYSKGTVALLGDSAHSSTPFLGAGAGQGYEDAAVLAELLVAAGRNPSINSLEKALEVYSAVRMPRSQYIVQASHEEGQILMGIQGSDDPGAEWVKTIHEGWEAKIDDIVDEALERFSKIC